MPQMIIVFIALLLVAVPGWATDIQQSEEQKTLYAIGLALSRSLAVFSLTPAEFEVVRQGLTDGQSGKKAAVDLAAYNDKVQEFARVRRNALGEKSAQEGQLFLEKFVKERGAKKTASGMAFISVKEGSGASPKPTDTVKVHYRGTLVDGTEIDNTYRLGKPAALGMEGAIKCWSEGLMLMKQGGQAKFVCPASLAYGEAGNGEHIVPGATLVFDIELVEITK